MCVCVCVCVSTFLSLLFSGLAFCFLCPFVAVDLVVRILRLFVCFMVVLDVNLLYNISIFCDVSSNWEVFR